MKILITITIALLVSVVSSAEVDCPIDPNDIVTEIEAQTSCYMAAKVARECAWGSLVDLQLVSAASTICTKDAENWSQSHKDISATLKTDCGKKFENSEGTLYRSATAHCILNVDEILSSLNEPVQ